MMFLAQIYIYHLRFGNILNFSIKRKQLFLLEIKFEMTCFVNNE